MNRTATRTAPTLNTTRALRAALAACVATLAGAAMVPAAGCSGTPDRVQNPNEITADDWREFSVVIWQRLEDSGLLETYRDDFGRAPSIAVGSFDNNTTNPRFTRTKNFLYRNLQSVIINSGSAEFNRQIAGAAGTREELLEDIRLLKDDPDYDPATFDQGRANIPDLILFGSVDSDRQQAGRVTQADYLVNVELIDTERNTAVWSEVVNVTKLWKKPLF